MHMIQPGIIFTLETQALSVAVLRILHELAPRDRNFTIEIFPGADDVFSYFQKEGPPAVALFDDLSSHNGFGRTGAFTYFSRVRENKWAKGTMHRRIPFWALSLDRTQWAVGIHRPRMSITKQIYHDFFVRFETQIASGLYPWGKPRKGEHGPRDLKD